MNNSVKSLIIFSAGLAIGGAAGYFLTKNHFAKIAEEEIVSVSQMYHEKINEYEEKFREHEEQILDAEEENKLYRKAIKDAGYTVYSNFASDDTDYDEGPQDDLPDSAPTPIPRKSTAYIIDDEQYHTEAMQYDKNEFRYYEEDQTFCAEDDEIIDDPVMLLGEAAVDAVIKQHELHNNDLTYVRNDSLGADYEIQYMQGSYKERVLGEYDDAVS